MKKTIVSLAGIAAFGMAQAANWTVMPIFSDRAQYLIDTESVVNEPSGIVRAWFKVRYSKPSTTADGQAFVEATFNNRFYCKTRQYSAGPTYTYDASGTNVSSSKGYAPLEDVVPDTISEAILNFVCGKKRQ